ncbi:MAG TPA: hypothetical protein VE869_13485 [Gemmatimonas sp.]|nr:hypothetical protein [Gemmatimonas sp.]
MRLLAFASVGVLACTADNALAPIDRTRLALGTWGGDNAGAVVADSITHIHIGCTNGDIAGRVTLDANGAFERDGTYQPRAHPVVNGPFVPARFTGRVQGRMLTVTVVVNDTVAGITRTYGPAVMQYAMEPRLGPCPICRVSLQDPFVKPRASH